MASENHIYKFSNAGGFKAATRYADMLAGNAVWNPWEPQGSYDALATVTVPSGGVSSITFTGIPTGYKHLQVRYLANQNRSDYPLCGTFMRFNSDSGSNYSDHYVAASFNSTTSPTAASDVSATKAFIGTVSAYPSVSSSIFGVGVIDILDYNNTNKYKTFKSLFGYDVNGTGGGGGTIGGGMVGLASGAWYNTSSINSITFISEFGTNVFGEYSQFALYGVK